MTIDGAQNSHDARHVLAGFRAHSLPASIVEDGTSLDVVVCRCGKRAGRSGNVLANG